MTPATSLLATSPLLTDLYQLNMMQAYLDHGETKTAVFEFFMRKLPARRGFLLAAGLEQALDFLEQLRFASEDIAWLAKSGRFGKGLLDYLGKLRFAGVMRCRRARCFLPTSRSCGSRRRCRRHN
jgi:nicotinate phosphoribosyltransferase